MRVSGGLGSKDDSPLGDESFWGLGFKGVVLRGLWSLAGLEARVLVDARRRLLTLIEVAEGR